MKKIILAVLLMVSSSLANRDDTIAGIGALLGAMGGIADNLSSQNLDANITKIIGEDAIASCKNEPTYALISKCKFQQVSKACFETHDISWYYHPNMTMDEVNELKQRINSSKEACLVAALMPEATHKVNERREYGMFETVDFYTRACYLKDKNSCSKIPKEKLLEVQKKVDSDKAYKISRDKRDQEESIVINKYYGLLDYDIAKTFDKGGLSPLVLKKNCNSKAVSGRTIILSNPFSVKGQCAIATVTIVKVDSPNTAIAEISGKPVYIVNSGNTLSNRILGNNTRFLWLFKVTGTTTLTNAYQGERVVPVLRLF